METYASIASEYYDETKHPTCANFESLSRLFMIPALNSLLPKAGCVIELGAGKSVTAPLSRSLNQANQCLILVDCSLGMLRYSNQWVSDRVKAVIADARWTGLSGGVADIVVSSLGDAYNTPDLWVEVARLLSSGGVCLFSTPAFEWATLFRSPDKIDQAEFELRDGRIVTVPSYIPSPQD